MEVPNYPNYTINCSGRDYSKKSKRYLTPYISDQGYKYLRFYKDNDRKGKWIKIHRLLAILFIENPKNLPFVDHYDGNTLNNCLSNLSWVSHVQNSQNISIHPSNKTGVRGVTIYKNYFQVTITINGKRTRKNFKTFEEAVKYRKLLEKKHYFGDGRS